MTLQLDQTTRMFTASDTTKVMLRTLHPSKPYGGWPGTTVTIHVWSKTHRGKRRSYYDHCTFEEINELEEVLGEWDNYEFLEHPTLGLVTSEKK